MQTLGLFSLVRIAKRVRRYCAVCLLAAALPLAGCGGSSSNGGGGGNPPPPPPPSGTPLQGSVHAGTMAVSGASIQMYAASGSGYGSAATALLSTAGTTDASGNFTVNYDCPAAASLVYVVAAGGNPGLTAGTNNAGLALMAALGPCGNLTSSSTVSINELTTVASIWPLAQFLSAGAGANLGTSSGNAQGLTNAFAKVGNLVNVTTGTGPGPSLPTGATIPTNELDTLADILNTCSGSDGSGCAALFSAATPGGALAPANTIDAALNLALNPGLNPGVLFALLTSPSSAPFQPVLSSAPSDWTIAITYTGGGLNAPSALAVDRAGNVWIADYNNALSEFSAQGQALSPTAGFTGGGLRESYGLTIDNGGNIWVTDQESPGAVNGGRGRVTKFDSNGQLLSGSGGFFTGGINFPYAAASDANGNIWVVNYGNSTATVLANSGAPLSGSSGYGGGQLAFPVAVAIDANQNAWLANQSNSTVTRISADGLQVQSFTCAAGPSGLAIDGQGNVWVANYFGDSICEVTSGGTVISTGYSGGGLLHPQGIAVDGKGNVWAANYLGNSITLLQGADGTSPGTALSPASGLGAAAGLSQPFALAVDGSGSLWISNFAVNTVTEFVGAASPVKTPLLGPAQKP